MSLAAYYKKCKKQLVERNTEKSERINKEVLEMAELWESQKASRKSENTDINTLFIETLKRVHEDYKGLITVCRHYSLHATYKDAMETMQYIENVIKTVEGEHMSLKQKISELNQEWADAGDDVPVELKYIRLLEGCIANACRELRDMIDGGEECRGRDSGISAVIRILEGEL